MSTKSFCVDASRCVPCEVCDKTCPKDIVHLVDGVAEIHETEMGHCNTCLHCAAFCPLKAIRHGDEVGDAQPAYRPRPDDNKRIDALLKSRRSIRHFRSDCIPHDELAEIFHTVGYAPTAANRREFRWIVTETPEATEKVHELVCDWWRSYPEGMDRKKVDFALERLSKGKDTYTGGAPHIAFCVCTKKTPYEAIDAGIALTYLNVALESRGYGALFSANSAKATVSPALRAFLKMAADETCVCAMCFGMMVFKPKSIPALLVEQPTYL